MMWHVLFIGILRNIQFPITTFKGKQCMLYNVLADDIRGMFKNNVDFHCSVNMF